MKSKKGFTLPELIIAIAILAIISTFAIRSYRGYLIKSRRAEAHVLLNQMMNRAQQYYLQNNNIYPNTLNAAYAPGTPPTSDFYNFSVGNCGTDCFQVIAIVRPNTSQARDLPDCTMLTLDSNGNRTPTTAACWNR